ncbi:3374_t:CDS:2, partial [Dentiscutata erythropus]
FEYDINNIIGAGIFATSSSVWRLVQSPGAALMIWLAGGFISLFDSTEELASPETRLKRSNISSVLIAFIFYFLTNVAFITVVDPINAIYSDDIIVDIPFWVNSEKRLFRYSSQFLLLYLLNSGSRIISYSAKTGFIPKFSDKLYYWDERFGTPFNALLLQFVYCAVLILLFPGAGSTGFFTFFAHMSGYLTVVFYGVSAICILILRIRPEKSEVFYSHF